MSTFKNMRIIEFDPRYRDDMIFLVLEAKDALGRVPRLNEDLLDIPAAYLAKGDMFWLALNENDRVIGCVGYSAIPGTKDVWLHRFYIKADLKRRGLGTVLYRHAEAYIRAQGKEHIRIHLGGKGYEGSVPFYQKMGYQFDGDASHMIKVL